MSQISDPQVTAAYYLDFLLCHCSSSLCSQPNSQEDILKPQITSLLHHVLILLRVKVLAVSAGPHVTDSPLPLTSLTSHPSRHCSETMLIMLQLSL